MKLDRIIDRKALAETIWDGYVRERRHPSLPLTIYNYTEKAQYEQAWDDVTRTCRGLIVDDDGNVVARPWPKFFNLAEHDGVRAPVIDLDSSCVTVDKLDGSLVIVTRYKGAIVVATRGSFESEQAKWAREWLRENAGDWSPREHITYLFETVYDENRIVLDYDFEGLVLLGCHDTETYTERTDASWPGRKADVLPPRTLRDALAMPDRANSEGVVCTVGTGPHRTMVKIKQDDYVALHKVVSGLSEKVVWQAIMDGRLADVIAAAPDEFHGWINSVAADITETADAMTEAAYTAHYATLGRAGGDRGAYAAIATKCDHPDMMFALLDGKDPWPLAVKRLKPRGDTYYKRGGSDA